MKNIHAIKIFAFICVSLFAFAKNPKNDKQWPRIQPISRTITLAESGPRSYNLFILNRSGVPVYLLECYLSAYDYEIEDWDFSGNFECKLTPLYEKQDSKYFGRLLSYTKTPTRDWESRGRFFVEDLQNPKYEAKGWGKKRTFRLRGMELTLNIKSFYITPKTRRPIWAIDDDNRVEKIELEILVKQNGEATANIDEVEPIRKEKR